MTIWLVVNCFTDRPTAANVPELLRCRDWNPDPQCILHYSVVLAPAWYLFTMMNVTHVEQPKTCIETVVITWRLLDQVEVELFLYGGVLVR